MPLPYRLIILFVLLFSAGDAAEEPEIVLEMQTDRTSVYTGESFIVNVDIRQHSASRAVDAEFRLPEPENVRIKLLERETLSEEDGAYRLTRLNYVVTAFESGTQELLPAQMKTARIVPARNSRGEWASSLSWKSFTSNTLTLDIKPLPEGVLSAGHFTITAVADKTEVDANEAVNVTLLISGSGNLDALPLRKPSIAGVTVFGETGEVAGNIEQGRYVGKLTEKLVYVSGQSFTIPPFTLRYFNTDTETVETAASAPIRVTVNAPVLKRPESETASADVLPTDEQGETGWEPSFFHGVAGGLLIGIVAMLIPWKRWFVKEAGHIAVDPDNHKSVLIRLLQYPDDPEALRMVRRLEGNLYEGKRDEINTRELKALLTRLGKQRSMTV